LAAPGASREDVEDQLRAVERLLADLALEVALLRRRQLVVEQDQVRAALLRELAHVLDLALAEQRRGVALLPLLDQAADDGRAGAGGQQPQLADRRLRAGARLGSDRKPDQ